MMSRMLAVVMVAVGLVAGACSEGGSVVGAYECLEPDPPPPAPPLPEAPPSTLELREDGTLTFVIRSPEGAPNPEVRHEGTWSAEGDSGVLTIVGQDIPFAMDGDRLAFDDGTLTCTRAS